MLERLLVTLSVALLLLLAAAPAGLVVAAQSDDVSRLAGSIDAGNEPFPPPMPPLFSGDGNCQGGNSCGG